MPKTESNKFFDLLEEQWENKSNGKWLDHLGWNFISQPKLNLPGSDDFEMRFDQMREKITFRKLSDKPARNVGITGKAGFWIAMAYEVCIETPNGENIHHEIGHFLMSVKDETGETHKKSEAPIIRQATIPRANAMMTAGELRPGSITDNRTDSSETYSAKPATDNPDLQKEIEKQLASKQDQVTKAGGPDLTSPLSWLKTKYPPDKDSPPPADWVFDFSEDKHPSQMASGQRVDNPVQIGNLISEFWIGLCKDEKSGEPFKILQYAQKVDLDFNGMYWPHMAVNTLIKQT